MAVSNPVPRSRLGAVLRDGDQVTPLELFFDLVFVLAITQCTTLMAHEPTWEGLGKAMLVFGLLWWAWAAYAWLTSVVDPEEGAVRIVMFATMAGLLICSLCVPRAFEDLALDFAIAYGVVRAAHIALFTIASRDDPTFRRSVMGIAVSTTIAVGLLVLASAFDGPIQAGLWALALFFDTAIPYVFGSEGWHLVPSHFAERHGLIVIIALGESIVAIGVGAGIDTHLDAGTATAAVLGVALTAAMWWAYFDIVSIVNTRRLAEAEVGREQNELARDAYSYIHLPIVAGIILVALGLKKTIGHPGDPLETVPAFALCGGLAIYLLGHVALRWRNIRTLSGRRFGLAMVLFALFPLATEASGLASLAIITVLAWLMILSETRMYGEGRYRVRHGESPADARAPRLTGDAGGT
jgi:low temperature requirement protein LtrA